MHQQRVAQGIPWKLCCGSAYEKIFNEHSIPQLARQLTEFQAKKDASYKNEEVRIAKNLRGTEKQIENIINAIVTGLPNAALMSKLDELEQQKEAIEKQMKLYRSKAQKSAVSEEALKQLLAAFKDHVTDRNLPEIMKLIGSYVKKVIVYKEDLELILKLNVKEKQKPQPLAVVVLHDGGERIAPLYIQNLRFRCRIWRYTPLLSE